MVLVRSSVEPGGSAGRPGSEWLREQGAKHESQVFPALIALRLAAFHRDRVCAKAVRVPRTLSYRFEILVLSGAGDPWVWSSLGTLGCTPLGSLAMAGCPAGAGSLRVLDTVLCFSAQLCLQTPVCMPGAFSCGREWRVLL